MNPKAIGRPLLDNPRSATRRRDIQAPATGDMSGMKEVLLSGCKANQYSMDAMFDGTPHGAMTYYALAAIRAANFQVTYRDLREQVLTALSDNNYDQEPQVEGADANLDRQIFT
jgi:hypothetical protein